MDNTLTLEPTEMETAELQAEIERLFSEMEQADERIRRHQDETEKLRLETHAILASLKAE